MFYIRSHTTWGARCQQDFLKCPKGLQHHHMFYHRKIKRPTPKMWAWTELQSWLKLQCGWDVKHLPSTGSWDLAPKTSSSLHTSDSSFLIILSVRTAKVLKKYKLDLDFGSVGQISCKPRAGVQVRQRHDGRVFTGHLCLIWQHWAMRHNGPCDLFELQWIIIICSYLLCVASLPWMCENVVSTGYWYDTALNSSIQLPHWHVVHKKLVLLNMSSFCLSSFYMKAELPL